MRNGQFQHEYFCSTYHKHVSGGQKEQCPCGRNTVIQDFLVERVAVTLQDVARQLEAIQQATRTGNLAMLEPFREKQLECCSRIIELAIEMQKYVFAREGEIVIRAGDGLMESVQRAYGALFTDDTSSARLSVENLKREHDELTQKLWQLEDQPGLKRVQEKTVARLRDLEAQMDRDEAMLTDLSQEMDKQQSIFKQTAERTEAAIKALDDESRCSAMRERNQAVRRAIRVIEVWFAPVSASDPRKTGQIRKNTTKIVQVRIVPIVGEPKTWKRGDDESMDSRARSHGRD